MGLTVHTAVERARHLLLDAAADPMLWAPALEAVARACSAHSGQLICNAGDAAIAFNLLTGTPEDVGQWGEACGLGDPAANPRLRAGLRAPTMVPIADQEYLSAEERRKSSIYASFFEPFDLMHNCQVVLHRSDTIMVRMSVTRTARQGPLDDSAFAAFRGIMPYARAAVHLHQRLGAASATGILTACTALDQAAVVLDARGKIVGLSTAAEALLAKGDWLTIKGQEIVARVPQVQAMVAARIAALLAARAQYRPPPEPMMVSAADGQAAMAVEFHLLPPTQSLFDRAAVLLVLKPDEIPPVTCGEMLRQRHGLTRAEAAVAEQLAAGVRPAEIAAQRGVAVVTIRSQIKVIYAKLGVSGQLQLAAFLQQLGSGAAIRR